MTSPSSHESASSAESVSGESLRGDLFSVFRGFCMGAADTVPGVSGGTVALILGHYTRLITAISRIDGQFLSLGRSRDIAGAAKHIDARFLIGLGAGILVGVATLSGLMHFLLDHHRPQILSVFLGFLVASVVIVRKEVTRWTPSRWVALVVGMALAIAITTLPVSHADPTHAYLFVAASVAICAMILPGISGAFVLVLFGVYHAVTGMIKETVKGNLAWDSLSRLAVFAIGCLFGLLAFSRLLRYLLARHHDLTMATLVGLMIGSIKKLYPLQRVTAETADLDHKEQIMQYIWPAAWPESVWPLVVLAVVSGGIILAVETRFGGETLDESAA